MQPSYEDLQRENAELKAQLGKALGRITGLEAVVTELQARLKRNSSNSSKPPSTDPPGTPRPANPPPSGRKPGGQPGHEGHQRPLLPPDQMARIIPVKPSQCGHCGMRLSGDDPNPERHQVADVPEPKVTWNEWDLHALTCPCCGEVTHAALPPGVPEGMLGPHLQGLISVCSGVYRLSKRMTAQLLSDAYHFSLSPASVVAAEQAVSEAVEIPVAEARAYVESQGKAHVDETGWRQRRAKAWLWVASTAWVTVFLIHRRRNKDAAHDLLGGFRGVIHTDRWKVYLAWSVWLRQLCWAHLIRDFRSFEDYGGADAQIGKALLVLVEQMFKWWERVRDGTLSRSTFRAYLIPLRGEVRKLLRQGTRSRTRKVAATCRDLLKLYPALWTFARVPGVEPTNNQAERMIRPGVMWRRVSFGTHSEAGSRFAERMLTTAATLKQQGRNVVDFVTRACDARLHGRRPPSLLPSRRLLTAAI